MTKKKQKASGSTATRVAVEPVPVEEPVPPVPVETPADEDISFEAAPPNQRFADLAKAAEAFKGWRPAREVLTTVRSVPTIFCQYDRATRVGGHPVERWTTVHGPSNHGKTLFLHGLGRSFLELGHFYAYVDTEQTTPITWVRGLMGELAMSGHFLASTTTIYEDVVEEVRELLHGVESLRETMPDLSALVVVDSLRKLVPRGLFDKVAKGESVDGAKGRGGMIRASFNANWLDELTPALRKSGAGMVAVLRESQDPTASERDKMFGNDYVVQGGNAAIYDSSLTVRTTRDRYVYDGDPKIGRVVGERHRLTLMKTKVGQKEGRNTVCWFHSSNGVLIPEGFDRARDVLELAREYKIVDEAGGWLKWGSMKWQGESAAVRKLTERADALANLEQLVRAKFSRDEQLPTEDE